MEKVQTKKLSGTRALVYCALFTSLLIVLSQIAIPLPFSPIPVTLGVLGVLLCGCILGSRLGAVSVAVYIIMGLIGLPVFAGLKSTAALTGPTGGYIVGYLPMVVLAGQAARLSKRSKPLYFVLLGVAMSACYALGTAWYSIYADVRFVAALMLCVVPFLLWDGVKIAIAGVLGLRLNKIRGTNRQ